MIKINKYIMNESLDECESRLEKKEPMIQVESFMIDQEFEEDPQVEAAKYLLNPEEDRAVDPETQARLEALLQAAGKFQLPQFNLRSLPEYK